VIVLWAPAIHAQEAAPLPEPLRLEQVMQLARERRAEITAARARARAAAQRPAIVSALEDPVVFPSIDHLPFMLNGVNASFTVEQRFPLSGILGNQQRAAEADARRLRAEVGRVELDVELEAANAFLMLQERRQTARILDEQHVFADQFVRAALARFSTGSSGQADVLRAEIEVARLDGALRSIAAEIRAAEAMLNTSLARPADAPVPAIDDAASAEALPSPQMVKQTALARRPELRAGRAEVSRAQAEVSVMRSMYTPMAMVRTGPAYTMADGMGWMLMVGISVPLWRGRLKAGVAEAQAMAEMSQADLQAMQRMIEGEAVTARALVIAAHERLIALRDEVLPRARQAIDPTLAGYTSGQLPLVSVIEAAQALWSAQAELVSAELSLGAAEARLRRATGDGGRTP
jgi:outer membrane protein TolC